MFELFGRTSWDFKNSSLSEAMADEGLDGFELLFELEARATSALVSEAGDIGCGI